MALNHIKNWEIFRTYTKAVVCQNPWGTTKLWDGNKINESFSDIIDQRNNKEDLSEESMNGKAD